MRGDGRGDGLDGLFERVEIPTRIQLREFRNGLGTSVVDGARWQDRWLIDAPPAAEGRPLRGLRSGAAGHAARPPPDATPH